MLINEDRIFLDLPLETKEEVLAFIAEKAVEQKISNSKEELYYQLLEREKEYNTAVQDGIAIPHTKSTCVNSAALFFVRLQNKINWESEDFNVQAIFSILVPKEEAGTKHIEILSNVATRLLDDDFQEVIFRVDNQKELLDLVNN